MVSQSVIPTIVIVGPTASGKTALAIELAEECGGEIVCADSRTVYKGMDIGTAKPTEDERRRVPHWGLDLVDLDEKFSVSDFKEYADARIADIRSRGNIPFLVGGTGLYIDSVLFNFRFGSKVNEALREHLQGLSLEELHQYCREKGIALPENQNNKRYVIRAIERAGRALEKDLSRLKEFIVVGIATDKNDLQGRITLRTEQLFSQPVVDEAKILGEKYGWGSEAMTGNIYPLIRAHLEGEMSLGEVKEKFTSLDRALARRQLTWFRRNPHIIWHTRSGAKRFIQELLAVRG